MWHISRNYPKKNRKLVEIDRVTADGPTDVTETGKTDRPPDKKTRTVSLMAVVERGKFNRGGLEWSFLIAGSTNTMEVNGKLTMQQFMAMSRTVQDTKTVSIIPTSWVLLENQ